MNNNTVIIGLLVVGWMLTTGFQMLGADYFMLTADCFMLGAGFEMLDAKEGD